MLRLVHLLLGKFQKQPQRLLHGSLAGKRFGDVIRPYDVDELAVPRGVLPAHGTFKL